MNLVKLNSKLNSSIGKYSFNQCIRMVLAHLYKKYPNEDFESLYKRLRFKANPSLSFAKSEIHEAKFVENSKGFRAEITLNFLTLSGASSPLPSHYSEMALNNHTEDKVLSDFLNFYNHHLHKMVYLIWEKQRYYMQYRDELEDKFSGYMLSVLGMYFKEQTENSKLNMKKLMPYIGVLSMKQKSTGTLTSVLRHYIDHDEVEIVQFIDMNANIPSWQRASLGVKNITLSDNFMLGESVKTKSLKFQVFLKNISWEWLFDYSILGKKMGELKELIRLTLSDPLESEFCLGIQKEKIQPVSLSSKYLGVNSFLGLPDNDVKIILNN